MEEGAQSSSYLILLLFVVKEEIAYGMLIGGSELIINKRFSKN